MVSYTARRKRLSKVGRSKSPSIGALHWGQWIHTALLQAWHLWSIINPPVPPSAVISVLETSKCHKTRALTSTSLQRLPGLWSLVDSILCFSLWFRESRSDLSATHKTSQRMTTVSPSLFFFHQTHSHTRARARTHTPHTPLTLARTHHTGSFLPADNVLM